MKHINILGKGRPPALAENSPDSITCGSCVSKTQGDFNACVDKGKCDLPEN